ncbi:hypothetical protein Lepto7376_2421 [[Leptolyngbya] sp. PCC 7376]|uniref:hypothetical protein n=1 Tax=[Leptolyngbya] sp. PCC 7376 TaxID=111781 RepID=UPI00029ED12C|nr:hypothetical protein [[Leptolyngbya] sp. PCC 7376]AFY38701.1 hypothetical protein Lepto7376_2421 [[Leptolyngbya] sp. PCC 7376]
MDKKFGLGCLAIATCFGLAQKATADEVWRTEEFGVVYAEDRGSTAIWEYGGGFGTVFLDGLAGQYEDRGTYYGYWVQASSSKKCDTFREGADGELTYYWGNVKVEFIDADFPSRWKLGLGLCDGERTIELNGTPVIP